MSVDQHLAALSTYEEAVEDLYGSGLDTRLTATAEEIQGPQADDDSVEKVVQASEALTESTVALLEADEDTVRESGEARLAARAARDIAMAYDIAQLHTEDRDMVAARGVVGPMLPQIEREVAFVLVGDPSLGVPPSPSSRGSLVALSISAADPRQALRVALPKAIEEVRDDATDVVVAGLAGLAGSQLDAALARLATGLLDQLPGTVKRWYKWALKLLKEGIKKLTGLFGGVFKKAVEKIAELAKKYASTAIADRVYGVPKLRDEVTTLVDKVSSDKDWARIEQLVQAVVDKYASQKKVVVAVFKALGLVRNWILRALAGPVGEVVVDGTFVLGAAYGLFAGGDYIDWHLTQNDGAFDFVCGVRRTAEAELA